MIKKNILIPYEKYEKLIAQSNTGNMNDSTDGQCISHTEHIEFNRDKYKDYSLNLPFDKKEPTKGHVSFGLQKGEGGLTVNANAGINESSIPETQTLSASSKKVSHNIHKGPPGRRQPKFKKKQKNQKWEIF